MEKRKIEDLTEDEFDALIEGYIAREVDEIPADQFCELVENMERIPVKKTIEVRAHLNNGQLVFEPEPSLMIAGNALFVGDTKIVITLAE